jgi:hypothetical protein
MAPMQTLLHRIREYACLVPLDTMRQPGSPPGLGSRTKSGLQRAPAAH